MCHPCRGFLVIVNPFSNHFRSGLRCDVPPGLQTRRKQNRNKTEARQICSLFGNRWAGSWESCCVILVLRNRCAMRREGLQIGRIYGIPIFLHTSWFLIFGLIAFSFVSEFDALQLSIPTSRLWGLGLMTSLLFFGSLVFHEMAHS